MSSSTFSTSDLRSGSKEFSRDKDHRVKWAHGQSYGPGRREEDARPRPARVIPTPKSVSPGPLHRIHGQAGMNKARGALRTDIADASGDSSADEEIEEPSAAPAPDAEITYSFDATRGPSHGSQILGQALAQAIERFEGRQTDKLIKEEYEVLDVDSDALSPTPKATKQKVIAPEDEEYEFIEA
ncbi:hypothetical protein P154DRAFT_480719 [Amniculicola lignicola CBS 123094]|uniref:Uncharacterized protein n=1 Tax=Amniculicola lignicola CBS 123094 TaxID=1392246 RepID=A0A6A5X0T7_9PLEO|nr:hypothetical protein P154DRAFT_480719 [Amniculicola lignicola CBS 123094]